MDPFTAVAARGPATALGSGPGAVLGNAITGQVQFHGTEPPRRAMSGSPPIQWLVITYNPLASPDTTHIMTWNCSFSTPLIISHQHTQEQNILFYSIHLFSGISHWHVLHHKRVRVLN